jgi:putative intracellular protease/amidase
MKDDMKILMVLTSHDNLGKTSQKTGLWLEEFTTPYFYFKDRGCKLTLCSPKGGRPPLDPKSGEKEYQTETTKRFSEDLEAQRVFNETLMLAEIKADDYDGVFYPGGHGPLWDLVDHPNSIYLIEKMLSNKKPVGSVCHGPAVLVNVKNEKGEAVVQNLKVTSFSNAEEIAIGLERIVPFLIEDKFKEQGGIYSCSAPWSAYAQSDGFVVTGQNPASSKAVAEEMLRIIEESKGQKQ